MARDRVSIDRSVDMAEWLDGLPVFVSSFSTMTVDAMIRRKPSISLENLVPFENIDLPSYKQPLRTDFVWKPGSVSEAVDLVKQAFRDELPVSPDEEKLSAFVRDNFNWPRQHPAYVIIADEIAKIVRNRPASQDNEQVYRASPIILRHYSIRISETHRAKKG